MDGRTRVREYQPVVHRLRLSASPSVPTYPGRISLPQEPLVNRRASFSLAFRYSCLHSHSCSLHGWVTPPLHALHDALLPIPSKTECRGFGGVLEPRYIVGAESLDQ